MNDKTPNRDPRRIVGELLRDDALSQADPGRANSRVAVLERQAPRLTSRARKAGVEIEHLGISSLFDKPRLYGGVETDWIIGPATGHDLVVPDEAAERLARLPRAGIDMPLIYVGHEVAKDRTAGLAPSPGLGFRELEPAKARELIGPVPAPAEVERISNQLEGPSAKILNGIYRTGAAAGTVAAAVAAAPLLLLELDPIVLGAIPAGEGNVGEPASWYLLAKWVW